METWKHCLRSMQMFGTTATELHYWIDSQWNFVEGDHSHRKILHTRQGLAFAREKFGHWVVPHFIQHMKDDNISTEGWRLWV